MAWLRMWAVSFGVWIPLSAYFGFVVYHWQRNSGEAVNFFPIAEKHIILYAFAGIFSPIVYTLGKRFPLESGKWMKHVPLHVAASLLFALTHAIYRISVLPVKDVMSNVPSSHLMVVWRFFVSYTMDSSIFIYWPIVALSQLALYRQRSLDREVRGAELQKELAEAQLRALKMQVHPHFFFNTLHAISSLMHTDVQSADKMIARLSELLRMSLEGSDVQECPLWQEMEFLEKYMQIEQIRFSDRLTVALEIDPETRDAVVPYMILQPLVENAVRHGVSKRTVGGIVRIRASRENGFLRLSVRDNGPGFSLPVNGQSGGLGLANTQERLKKLYGMRQNFSMQMVPGEGVEVVLLLPFTVQMETIPAGKLARQSELER